MTVAAVEAGTRALSPTEQAGLCGVFRRSWPDFLSLEDDEDHLLLAGRSWAPAQVAVQTAPAVWVRWTSFIETLRDGVPLYAGSVGGPPTQPGDIADLVVAQPGDAAIDAMPDDTDRKAARSLGTTAEEVRRAALGMWGQSLSAERDRLLGEGAGPDDTARTLQARRGHITRSLTAALREVVGISSGTRGT